MVLSLFLIGVGVLVALVYRAKRQEIQRAPWRTIHDPMMMQWARLIGYESGRAEREGRPVNVWSVLPLLAQAAHPTSNIGECLLYMATQVERLKTFEDEPLLYDILAQHSEPTADLDQVDRDHIRSVFQEIDNEEGHARHLLVCAIVAGVVEERFGREERGRYLVEVIRGNAR